MMTVKKEGVFDLSKSNNKNKKKREYLIWQKVTTKIT
jgi:hypothetical protein